MVKQEFRGLVVEVEEIAEHWSRKYAALSGCAGLADVRAAITAAPDPALTALLTETGLGCPVAPRVVMSALKPKLIRMAARDRAAGLADYLAALWLVILGYRLDRRPTRIAANLVLDTLKAVKAEQAGCQVPAGPLDRPLPVNDELSARRLLRTAAERRLINPVIHATLVGVYAEGLSEPEVAARHKVTALTVRRRCRRGIRTLAAHATELAEAG